MRVISLNIRRISKDKLSVLFRYIPQDTLVIALQETHCDSRKAKEVQGWIGNWKVHWRLGQTNFLEVALLFRGGWFTVLQQMIEKLKLEL